MLNIQKHVQCQQRLSAHFSSSFNSIQSSQPSQTTTHTHRIQSRSQQANPSKSVHVSVQHVKSSDWIDQTNPNRPVHHAIWNEHTLPAGKLTSSGCHDNMSCREWNCLKPATHGAAPNTSHQPMRDEMTHHLARHNSTSWAVQVRKQSATN